MALDDSMVLNTLSAIRRIEDEYILALEKTMRNLERNLIPLLDQYRVIEAADAALARRDIQRILTESGYYRVTGELLNEGYQEAIEEVQALYFASVGENFQFAEASLERLNALKNLDLGEYNKLADGFTTTLTRTLTDINFGAVSANQAVQTLQDNVDKLGGHASTWIRTGLSAIYRESSIALAEDNGITRYIYKGPLDIKTREFCREHLNEIKTKAEWDELDNGQITPVSTFGGGFNCRHQLIGVD